MNAAFRRALLLAAASAAACKGSVAVQEAGSVDASDIVYQPPDVAPRDTGVDLVDASAPDVPAVDSAYAVPANVDGRNQSPCGTATPVSPVWWQAPSRVTDCGDWLYPSGGTAYRWSTSTTYDTFVFGVPSPFFFDMACNSNGLWISESSDTWQAVLHGTDLLHPATIVISEPFAGGIGGVVATDQLVAFNYYGVGGVSRIRVANGDLSNLHDLVTPNGRVVGSLGTTQIAASGPNLVFDWGNDIWLWNVTTDRAENLTNDPYAQWQPDIDGNRVVWIDERDTPGASSGTPNNPEVYSMDLTTRVVTRITHDPPSAPAQQLEPIVQGDWILWTDYRDTALPNPPQIGGYQEGIDIWGYNFATGTTIPIFSRPGGTAGSARIYGDRVYFVCGHDYIDDAGTHRAGADGLYSIPLPSAGGGAVRDH